MGAEKKVKTERGRRGRNRKKERREMKPKTGVERR
jgi:hypothetical protein